MFMFENVLNREATEEDQIKCIWCFLIHTSVLPVTKSKCPSYVGITGIILQEFKHVFKIITKEDKLKGIEGILFRSFHNLHHKKILEHTLHFMPLSTWVYISAFGCLHRVAEVTTQQPNLLPETHIIRDEQFLKCATLNCMLLHEDWLW